ncbi:MAG: TonB-dependent receptor [Opitutus sp.]|nr:TonB-dependent receptor [Opitutus sp.]
MKPTSTKKRLFVGLMATILALAASVFGQGITTSAVSGFVTNKSGAPLGGATVTALHEPSGTSASTTSRPNGQYNISGLRVGGPYTVTVSAPGEAADTRKNIFLDLGDATPLNISIGAEVVTMERFTVAGERDVTFGAGKIGTGTTMGEQEISNVATVRRDIQDLAVLDSRFALMSLDQGGQLSAQGQNFRFNSLLIDGVVATDTFGLNSNGFSSLRSPIPLEALQSASFELTPYDVRRAGFTGALLNLVTKSGTNTFNGSAYYEYTDQDMRAKNPVSGLKETFKERTFGVTFGGPIIKDKLFFFLSYDDFERTSTPPQANFIPDATQLAAVVARAQTLGYSGGDLLANNIAFQKTTIGKLDWNVFEGQRLSLTYRKNEGETTSFASYTGATTTSLSNFWYAQPRITESYAAQLNSQWHSNFRTEVTASYTEFDGSPANNGAPFPQVQVLGLTGRRFDTGATITNGAVFFGTESSRQLNAITTKETQLKFSGEYSMGAHTITAGAEDVLTKYTNAFVQFTNGYYTFGSLAAWQAGTPPTAYQLAKPYPGSTIQNAVARWEYDAYAGFIQDTWKPNQQLTLLGGLRLDYPNVPDAPPAAAGFANAGFTTQSGKAVTRNNTKNSGNWTLAPRVGFIYNVATDRKMQVRGGVGLFQGKSPAVWISNAYSNAGSVYNYTATTAELPGITFNPNPATQSVAGTATPAPNININDPDFIQPSLWKSNLAVDHKLPFGGLTLTAEIYYNKVQDGINTEFLNYALPTTGPGTAPDGRIRYNGTIANTTGPVVNGRRRVVTGGPAGTGFADVFYLTNTKKGEAKGVTLAVGRPLRNNWAWSASWTHGHATEVSPITSSTASSNYSNRASFNPNEDFASTSNTDIRDRIVAQVTRRFTFIKQAPTTFSLIYQTRTGHPYSWVFRGDANGDGYAFNDLIYVPTGPADPKVTWASTTERDAFFAFVNSSSLGKYAGGHPGRNSETSPWNQTLDLKITQEIPLFKRARAEVYLNIINFGNLLKDSWGLYEEVPFSYRRAVAAPTAYNPAGNGGQGSWAYTFNGGTLDGLPIVANDFPVSRWHMQLGMRIKF